jgi:tripartite-type tricarboxylate transporter receptor subunit TctC
VIEKLHGAYQQALSEPAVVARLAAMGSVAPALTPAQFADMVRAEREKYREIVRLSGAQVN